MVSMAMHISPSYYFIVSPNFFTNPEMKKFAFLHRRFSKGRLFALIRTIFVTQVHRGKGTKAQRHKAFGISAVFHRNHASTFASKGEETKKPKK
jgi:hypothetical protein